MSVVRNCVRIKVTEWLERGHENLFKTRNNALNNIHVWAMIQKEYWCLI